ncbi:hypothetical protein DFH07DRAFT_891597 [Mycena maculata]|uniref:F-box domain-containing protein n=1 Tax=Mycena maculata TaxID=230809 RepID=A0AAD7IED5_9AGAR|nr:hypothetical protein DFH07DRAFT_891597 [Mycena maculata]
MFADLSDAKTTRAAARARIIELDIEIDAIQRLLEARLHEREECREELGSYKYPILTLPLEITSEIFTHFVPPYPERSALVGRDSPAHLACICRAWRTVALSTPTLWSAIELRLDDADWFEHGLQLLKKWLTRSGGCHLSIALMHYGERSVAAFVEAIACHASRWQDIELLLPYEDLRHITGNMPLLRTLSAPNLKEVVLSSCFNPFCITLPWSQITKLTARLYEIEAIAILRQAAALEECCYTLFCQLSSPIPLIPLIPPLPSLRSLVLSVPSTWRTAGPILLPALTLPALESIQVFEPFLGADPVATLSALRAYGYPGRIVISGARSSSDTTTPYQMYAAAFPEATVQVELELEDESDSDHSD